MVAVVAVVAASYQCRPKASLHRLRGRRVSVISLKSPQLEWDLLQRPFTVGASHPNALVLIPYTTILLSLIIGYYVAVCNNRRGIIGGIALKRTGEHPLSDGAATY